MWKYTHQVKIRWAFFVLSIFAVAGFVYYALGHFPDLSFRVSVEAAVTNVSVSLELMPVWFWIAISLLAILLLMFGFPSALFFAICLVISNLWIALIVNVIFQTIASVLTIFVSRKYNFSDNLPRNLESAILATTEKVKDFTFWSRIYISYPQRTIDLITAKMMSENETILQFITNIIMGIMIRLCVPAMWFYTFINVTYKVSVFPKQASTNFLIASTALVFILLLPKMPELMPCPSATKLILKKLETEEPLKEEVDKEKTEGIDEDTGKNSGTNEDEKLQAV